jgi:chaperonin cofactor prefoldin
MEIMQTQLQEGVERLQNFQKQQQKTLTSRQMLDSQLNENKLVNFLSESSVLFVSKNF